MTGIAVLKVDDLGRRPLLIGGVSGIVCISCNLKVKTAQRRESSAFHMYMYVYMHDCMYACVYVYLYMHTCMLCMYLLKRLVILGINHAYQSTSLNFAPVVFTIYAVASVPG